MIHDASTVLSFAASPDPVGRAHTPGANPRGVGVIIFHGTDGIDAITSITYGGVSMPRITTATDSATEPGKVYAYFLGKGIPTGTQTFLIDHNAAAVSRMAVCFTVLGSSDIRVFSSGIAEANQANPAVTITTPREALMYCGIYSGLASVTSLGLRTNMSSLASLDFGAFVGRIDRMTSPNSGSFTMGYSAATDDVAFTTIAIMEEEIQQLVSDAVFLPPISATATIERIRQEVGVLLSDAFAATTVTGIIVITRLIQDNLGVADPSMPRSDQAHLLADTTQLNDALIRVLDRLLFSQDSVLPSDALTRVLDRTLFSQDSVLLSDKVLKEIGLLEADRLILSDFHTADKIAILELLRLAQDSLLMSDLRFSGRDATIQDRLFPLTDQATASFILGELLRLVQDTILMSDRTIRERSSIISDIIKDIDEGSLMRVRSLLVLQPTQVSDAARKLLLEKMISERVILPLEIPLASFDHIHADSVFPVTDTATAERIVAQIISRLIQDSVVLSDRFYLDIAKMFVDRLVVSDAMSSERIVTRLAQDALRLEEVRKSLLEKEVRESLGLTDTAVAQLIQALIVRLVQDAVAMEDRRASVVEKTVKDFLVESDLARAQALVLRLVQDALALRDVRLSDLDKRLIESLGLTDAFVAETAQVIARLAQDALVLEDRRSMLLEKSFRDFLVISDFATAQRVVFSQTVERLAQDSLLLSDMVARGIEHTERERMLLEDSILRQASYLRTQVVLLGLADASVLQKERNRLERDRVLVEDIVQRLMGLHIREPVTLADQRMTQLTLAVLERLVGIRIAMIRFLHTEVGFNEFMIIRPQFEAFMGVEAGILASED